jgi:hypothetical protein
MERQIVAVWFLLCSFSAHAGEVNLDGVFHPDGVTGQLANTLWVVSVLSIYADWATTRDMGKYYDTPNPKTGMTYKENGMFGLFGDHPSAGTVNAYFGTMLMINLAFNTYDVLSGYRLYANTYFTTVHLSAARHNISLGLSVGF